MTEKKQLMASSDRLNRWTAADARREKRIEWYFDSRGVRHWLVGLRSGERCTGATARTLPVAIDNALAKMQRWSVQ